MNPQPQPQLDPQVVALTKAIRTVESNGDFTAKGKSGEYGAYQFMPATWKGLAGKYLGDPNADITNPENQNQVAYKQVAEWKAQGKNVGQIASMWNAGPKNENAYLAGNAGTNSKGVAYDTKAYATKVATAYQGFKQATDGVSQGNTGISTAQASTGQTTPQQAPQPQGDMISQAAANPNADWLDKAANIVSTIFPGRQIGQDIGTLMGYIAAKTNDAIHGTDTAKYYNLDAPTPLQAVGDVAQGALMVGTGMPEGEGVSVLGKTIPTLAKPASMLGRVAENTALGAGFGATGAIASGNNKDIGSSAAAGALFGGAAGAVGEGLSKMADILPKHLLQSALPQLKNPETMDYALSKVKLGTMDGMIQNSQKAINSYDNQVEAILAHPQYGAERITGADIASKVIESMPNSEYDLPTIVSKLKTQVPSEAYTLSRLGNGEQLTLEQGNTLRKALDKITWKSTIDSPEVRAGKDLAAAVGNAIRDTVQTKAPETAPIFSDYSKEIRLFRALKSSAGKGVGNKLVTMKNLRQLLFAGGGGFLGGLPGMAVGAATDAALESPVTKIAGAKLASKTAPLVKGAGQAAKLAGAVVPGRVEANK